jgi:hypothetical protein
VVLFVSGHGITTPGHHWIVLANTKTGKPASTALDTEQLVSWFGESDIDHLLVILDLCHAGAAGEATVRLPPFPPSWLVLASTTRDQQAQTGALTSAIAGFLEEVRSPAGQQYDHGEYLHVSDFLEAVRSRLSGQRLSGLHTVFPDLGPSPCLPNPRHRAEAQLVDSARRDLAIRRADLAAHWIPKSGGSETGWLFTGRAELMRHLISRLTTTTAPIVVTGGAGTGKSAVLGRLVTLSDSRFRTEHPDLLAAIPEDQQPPPGSVDVAVLATGKTSEDVLSQIVRAGGAAPAGASSTALHTLRQVWVDWLARHTGPITVVIDALDEAKNPPLLLQEVLTQLAPTGTDSAKVRLVVGVRSPGGRDDTRVGATSTAGQTLADRAVTALRAERLPVDEDPWWQDNDLADYAYDLLTRTVDSPYRTAEHHTAARAVAQLIATRAQKSFLVTNLAATQAAKKSTRIDPTDPAWLATLDDGVLGVFRKDLHTTLPDPDKRLRAIHLLRAVAFAYGAGLPWSQIWPLVANAVADRPGTYGDNDIVELLASRLGGYLVTDQEDGITVYRLFHDSLRTTLRERWLDLHRPDTGP